MPKDVGELNSLLFRFVWALFFENTSKPISALPDRTFGIVVMQPLKRIMMLQAARIFSMHVI